MQRFIPALTLVCLVCLPSCGSNEQTDTGTIAERPGKSLVVFVVNYPLQYFAERIGGDEVTVVLPAPADEDPAFWSPTAEVISQFQQADLILLNGAGYARWTNRATLPGSRLVDTSIGFAGEFVQENEDITHTHGPDGAHSHGEIAFTTWLDPLQALEQARAVFDAFVAARPEASSLFEKRFALLETDLAGLNERLLQAASSIGDAPLLGSHPVYQYLARRYALKMRSVHFEPDTAPDEKMWSGLASLHTSHPARWMLWEDTPLPATAGRLSTMGIKSLIYNPTGNRPAQGDYLSIMLSNIDNLSEAASR